MSSWTLTKVLETLVSRLLISGHRRTLISMPDTQGLEMARRPDLGIDTADCEYR